MPPSINPVPVLRLCVLRHRQPFPRPGNAVIGVKRPAHRTFADNKSKDLPQAPEGEAGMNMNQQEHVSEEAAKMAKIQGKEGPDIEGQGTPVQDILKDEESIRKQAPKVMKEEAKSSNSTTKPSTRPFSTLARRRQQLTPSSDSSSIDPALLFSSTAQNHSVSPPGIAPTQSGSTIDKPLGHKFPLPPPVLPRNAHKDHRYDPIVAQITNLMMRDGKKSVAQRNMATILTILRTEAPPTYNPATPLLPGAPPASHLPLNPILYLTLAIDSVAPLLRIRSQRGAAGGGVALPIPVPLGLRQRRRQAFMWILTAATNRKSRGSGRDMFARKVADELIAVVEGRSTVWQRRNEVHKSGTTARSNLNFGRPGRR